MIYTFELITAKGNVSFLQEFDQRLTWIKEKNYSFNFDILHEEKAETGFVFLNLKGDSIDDVFRNEDIIYIFKHQLAEVLAEHIISDWELKLIEKEIFRRYKGVSAEDKKLIQQKAYGFLKKYNENESLNLFIRFSRKSRISRKILDYISDKDLLILEGFVNFCLQDYMKEIRFAVDLAFEELKNEKEYDEFIKLLRYLVDTQVPKVFEVNLMVGSDKDFYLWDEKGVQIKESYLRHYLDDMLLDEVDLDDVLISILVTIAPRRIVFHNIEHLLGNEPFEMIKRVFKDKIEICTGCERCYKYMREREKDHWRS